MAITRAQQAKQLLQDGGMLVKSSTDGKRPGYRSAKTQEVQGRTTKSRGISPGQAAAMFGTDKAGTYAGMDEAAAEATIRSEVTRQRNKAKLDKFKAKKPEVKFRLGPFDALTGGKFAQGFANFLASKNRPFFEEVIRAGKIPGLNFATLSDMTDEELEEAYQQYDSDRLAGKIDAYGNPHPTYGKDQGDYSDSGLISMLPVVDEPETTEPEPEQLLTSRILGSQFAADGGRIGFKGGADMGTVSGDTRKATAKSVNISPGGNVTTSRDRGPDRPDDRSTFEQNVNQRKAINEANRKKPSNLEKIFRTGSELNYLRNLIRMNPKGLGLSYFTNKIGNFLFPPAGAAEMTAEDKAQLLKDAGIESGTLDQKGYSDSIKEVIGDGTVTAGGEITETIPDLTDPKLAGSIAEAGGLSTGFKTIGQKEAFGVAIPGTGEQIRVPTNLSQKTLEEIQKDKRVNELTRDQVIEKALDLNYSSPFIKEEDVGSIYDMVSLPGQNRFTAAGGGIASLDREAFLLGGLAKGLKKAVRGVKKLVKSPIGKAALIGAGFGLAGMGPMKGLFASGKGLGFKQLLLGGKTLPPSLGFKSKGLLGLLKANPMATIFGVSALAGGMTPKEEDDNELARYLASQKLDPSLSVRGTGSEFDFYGGQFVADGGRIGYQEGSKEPVAKKTLPLIDMDGKEKDYRETGGFVDMGRMEKADDVPARLSKNEFVFTADAVRNAGEGDIDKGAEVMYNMMKNLEAGGEVSEESQGLEGARKMFQTSQRLEEVL